MCRIVGLIDSRNKEGLNADIKAILEKMCDTMSAGGPDGSGICINGNIGFGHRRLAIIDLSNAGAQPMEFGKWVITFNGEIYNYQELKNDLIANGYQFVTHTDTEVIVKSIDFWGLKAIDRFRGMFAFALWNKEDQKLFLVRDRLGVKPLYYYLKDGLFFFASELKAFHSHPDFDKEIDLNSIPHFLQKGYIHPKQCIFKYVRKVKPGSVIKLDQDLNISEEIYWDVEDRCRNSTIDGRDYDAITEDLEDVLTESFQYRMVSDVPVGIFLSGGIDSALLVTLLQRNNSSPVRTFTIGFEDSRYNESVSAREVADILGTNHTAYQCSENDFKSIIPTLSEIYDEPFGDSSSIPTILVSQLARNQVKVVLSGDGGDELFGGYSKYHFSRHSSLILNTPIALRKMLYKASFLLSPNQIERLAARIGMSRYSQIGGKYFKFQNVLLADSFDDFFEKSSSYLLDEQLTKLTRQSTYKDNTKISGSEGRLITYLGVKDMVSYLPGDILTKVDRASMSVGLEAREPFLDQNIVDFALRIEDKFKFDKNEKGKFLLKKILKKYIPATIVDRPKQGFSIPIEKWMKSILYNDLVELVDDSSFFERFQLDQEVCKEYFRSFHNDENRINPNEIWFIYCLHQWYKRWL